MPNIQTSNQENSNMYKLFSRLVAASMLLLVSCLSVAQSLDEQTVVVSGFGVSPDLAAQNAAQNALTQVVGTFIDSETLVKKRKEISDGVTNVTKEITSRVNEFSQGSIKSIEILDIGSQGPFVKVNAKVVVRVTDFKAYIKTYAEGEVSLNQGLFAQVATVQKNEQSRESIIFNKILLPLLSGEASEFVVGKPVLLANSEYSDLFSEYPNSQLANKSSVVIPVEIKLKDGFLSDAISTLDSIADKKRNLTLREINDYLLYGVPNRMKTKTLIIRNSSGSIISYEFSEACEGKIDTPRTKRLDLGEKSTFQLHNSPFCSTNYSRDAVYQYEKSFSRLQMTVLDTDGAPITEIRSTASNGMSQTFENKKLGYFVFLAEKVKKPALSRLFYINYLNITNSDLLWNNIASPHPTIVDSQKLLLLVNLPSEELRKISKINFTFATN